MISPGRLLLRCRQRLRGGLRASYWREVVRPRILRTSPVTSTDDPRCEIHVLTSAGDWLDLVWALKSFYRHSGRSYRLCIHDDGTLGPERMATLATHFPQARVISRSEADGAVLPALAFHPRCREFRKTNHLSPKVFDFAHYLTADRMLLLDSDVLFFAEPTELLRRIEDANYRKNCANGDVASAYTVEPADAKRLAGVDLIERFNSGLGLIHKDSLRLDWLEEFLGLPGVIGHFWRIEQTLFALCSSRFGAELLPPEYDVRLIGEVGAAPSRHYVGRIRHLLYGEGIRHLVRRGFLHRAPWK
jgi:hypothetical protein